MKDTKKQPNCDSRDPKPIQISSGLADDLDEYSVEVLEAALNILQSRTKKRRSHCKNQVPGDIAH